MKKNSTRITKMHTQMCKQGLDPKETFHKAKLLLKIYRDVVWALHEEVELTRMQAYELGGQSLEAGLCYLEVFAPDIDAGEFSDKVCRLVESKMLVDVIDRALVRLKEYPVHGELYFQILTKQFIYKLNYTEKEMLEELCVERSTFYERKKEAIHLFAICLFGYTIPNLLNEKVTLNIA